jgi:glutaryl-CoA dehydrogenase
VFYETKDALQPLKSLWLKEQCRYGIHIAREARQMLGGMGITGEYSIMRHMMNLESVITYEGTHDIHLLITGMDITEFLHLNSN